MGNHYEKNTYKLLFVKILHLLVSVALFYVVWLYFRYEGLTITDKTGFRYNYLVAVGYGVLLFWFNKTYNSYLFGYTRIRLLVFGQILSQLFSIVIVYVVISVGWSRFRSPLPFIPMLGIQLIFDMLWSYFANSYYCRLNPRRKTLLIYRNQLDKKRFGSIKGKPTERLYEITDDITAH